MPTDPKREVIFYRVRGGYHGDKGVANEVRALRGVTNLRDRGFRTFRNARVLDTPLVEGGASDNPVAFVGEIGVTTAYQVTRHFAIRGGYQLLWISGAALAAEHPTGAGHERGKCGRGRSGGGDQGGGATGPGVEEAGAKGVGPVERSGVQEAVLFGQALPVLVHRLPGKDGAVGVGDGHRHAGVAGGRALRAVSLRARGQHPG